MCALEGLENLCEPERELWPLGEGTNVFLVDKHRRTQRLLLDALCGRDRAQSHFSVKLEHGVHSVVSMSQMRTASNLSPTSFSKDGWWTSGSVSSEQSTWKLISNSLRLRLLGYSFICQLNKNRVDFKVTGRVVSTRFFFLLWTRFGCSVFIDSVISDVFQ